jgi:hypothetical protein
LKPRERDKSLCVAGMESTAKRDNREKKTF